MLKVYGSGVKSIQILHRSGKSNSYADALSRNPTDKSGPVPGLDMETHVAIVSTSTPSEQQLMLPNTVSGMLNQVFDSNNGGPVSFAEEQQKDPAFLEIFAFLQSDQLPEDESRATKIALQAPLLALSDSTLYYVDPKDPNKGKYLVVPQHL